MVLSGIGGAGKTALAGQLVAGQQPSSLLVVVTGPETVDALFDAVLKVVVRDEQLRPDLGISPEMVRAANYAANSSLPWRDRLAALRTHIFEHIPTLVVLDNFEDNLDADRALIDEQIGALLSGWVVDNGLSHSPHYFALPVLSA